MKKIVFIIVPVVVFFVNVAVAAYASVVVANFLVDDLYLVGWWVFPDAAIAIAVAMLVYLFLQRVAYALHLSLD